MSGPVGYRTIGSASRSSTAARNRRAVNVPATHRFRSTDTVSTSARSGTEASPAAASRDRAATPDWPSSPTTFARTQASTTINAVDPHQGLRPQSRAPRAHLGESRSAPTPASSSVYERAVSVRRRGTAATIDRAPQRGAASRRGHPREDRGPRRSACLHYAIILVPFARPNSAQATTLQETQHRTARRLAPVSRPLEINPYERAHR